MFTGLVEEVGTLHSVSKQGEAMVLCIRANKILEGVKLGDSIAVNGVCLTVTAHHGTSFHADVMPQTYRHTNLKQLQPGASVNLERAMAANGRFGGHIVQGHVDGTAVIVNRQVEANAVVFEFQLEHSGIGRYMIPKGSIAIDGISLTLIHADDCSFAVSIIPHTLSKTSLAHKKMGDTVNVECDVLGKYVEKLLRFASTNDHSFGANSEQSSSKSSKLTESFLSEHGFF
ncbi:riboflavin synthase [Paenibacillus sp. SC116]|uniref:riboflavin synthase n=1 Tax=Paenibacillus sp. SC116 TaxID=2968986 RepID=UPI00215B48D8|nr:riboflavin synthase [Paenibacillus sp. SC116]MCR8843017.1 riboflavin synthase [Paenibacillus sp. SC116]